jgi:fatty acid desaturase
MSEPSFEALCAPPRAHFAFYWSSVVLFFVFIAIHNFASILAIVPMIIVSHGAHEAVHGTLVPRSIRGIIIRKASEWVGFAILGQSFILMRWSHRLHHKEGRRRVENTIEQAPYIYKRNGRLKYYLLLAGGAAVYYEIAAYLYPLAGEKYHILSRKFRNRHYRTKEYLFCQLSVLILNVCFYSVGGKYFFAVKLMFLIYWGMGQNVAHYGLAVNDSWSGVIASRTYRGPRWLEFILFRAGFYHLEHHVLPMIPGPNLAHSLVKVRLNEKLNDERSVIPGTLSQYIKDYFVQFAGPIRQRR